MESLLKMFIVIEKCTCHYHVHHQCRQQNHTFHAIVWNHVKISNTTLNTNGIFIKCSSLLRTAPIAAMHIISIGNKIISFITLCKNISKISNTTLNTNGIFIKTLIIQTAPVTITRIISVGRKTLYLLIF